MPALGKPVWREKTKGCLPFAKPFRKIWLNSKQGFWNVIRVFTPHPPTERDDIHVVLVWNFREQRNICRGTYQRAYHFYGTFGQNFPTNGRSIFFFRTENGNTVVLYHLPNIGKSFAFTRDWHLKSTQMVQKISVVLACVHPFFLAPIYFPVPAT